GGPKQAGAFVKDWGESGLGMHNSEGVSHPLPPPSRRDKDGKPMKSGLSWRVHILPFIELDNLYRQFKFDEPWDSEHNKKLIAQMPRIYQGLSKKLNDEGKTIFVVPAGEGPMFPQAGPMTIARVEDGTANTIMASLADDDHAVVWTKPDDITIDWKNPLKGFRAGADGWLVLMGDGSLRRFAGNLDAKKATALLTAAAADLIELDPADEVPHPPAAPAQPAPLFDLRLDDEARRELEKMGVDLNKVRRVLRHGVRGQGGLHPPHAAQLVGY